MVGLISPVVTWRKLVKKKKTTRRERKTNPSAYLSLDHGAESGPVPPGTGVPRQTQDDPEGARGEGGGAPAAREELAEGRCPAEQGQQAAAADEQQGSGGQ